MYMKKPDPKPTTKKKVSKKATTPKPPQRETELLDMLLKPGKYAAPVEDLPLGTKDGKPALKKHFNYPTGVSKDRMVEAFINVLSVNGKLVTIEVTDLYPALMNRVKDYCNKYDLLRCESSTKDLRIRKNLERITKALRTLGYLSPINPHNTICFVKLPPPGFDISSALKARARADRAKAKAQAKA
jgi:hypothetical protein